MGHGQNFDGRDSGQLPKPAVPPEFQDRVRSRRHERALDGGQQTGTGDWRGRDPQGGNGYQRPGGHQGYGQYPPQPGQWQGYGQPFPQQPPLAPTLTARRGRSWPARHKALAGLFIFAGVIIIIIVAANSGGSPSPSGGAATAGTQPSASAPSATPKAPATKAAATKQTITYEVTGSAADVTYGPAGSSLSGTVPMKVTAKLGDPVYYSVTAQLQGGGSVTVKILIDGTVISHGTATGGYNIATAEISKDPLSGQWADTNSG